MANADESLAASSSPHFTSHAEPTSITQSQTQRPADVLQSSTPVEMSQLQPQSYQQDDMPAPAPIASTSSLNNESSQPQTSTTMTHPEPIFMGRDAETDCAPLPMPTPLPPALIMDEPAGPSDRSRANSTGIGPSSEGPLVTAEESREATLLINLLLTTGARHPYTLDQKYLRRRNVATATKEVDPFSISVYTLKELIWRDWREEWEPRPTSPSSIRLIHFGKLLDDKSSLRDCRFLPSAPNVVHMTIKPQDVIDDEENAKTSKAMSRRGDDDSEGGCRCCIIQ